MKKLYLVPVCIALLTSSCSRVANKVAYGSSKAEQVVSKTKTDWLSVKPQTPPPAPQPSVYSTQPQNTEDPGVKELRTELKMAKIYYDTRLEQLETRIKADEKQTSSYSLQLMNANQQIAAQQSKIDQLERSITALSDKVSVIPQPHPEPAKITVVDQNMGEMAVVDGASIRKAKDGTITARSRSSATTTIYRPRQASREYYTGPRGGCYYYASSGRKEYVDRSLCR